MKNTKQAKVRKDARTLGSKCDWYKHENLQAVEAANPTYSVGNKLCAGAYFVEVVTRVHDEMFGWETYRKTVAGPFAYEADAQNWADAYNNCPF